MEHTERHDTSTSLPKRLLALVILAVAAWILLKVVIGIIAGVSTVIVVVLAIVAVFWALRTL
ncbi:MAG: hypothetical protein QOG11_1226 [Solirubrobacteraceae bacterium]|jgi:uncharacterized membrane protein|nr:hypothetical protein [Solirubrobacteraceae bacterium]